MIRWALLLGTEITERARRKGSGLMGWANCGEDSKGRPIGYAHEATCDHPEGCGKKIDRGLSYACGGMHGEDSHYCENYFCEPHMVFITVEGKSLQVCFACARLARENGIDEDYESEENL